MLRKYFFILLAVLSASIIFAQSSGTIQGKVIDAKTGEPIAFGNVSIIDGGKIITGGMTDFDGNFVIKPVPAGKHNLRASYVGYKDVQYNNVVVSPGKITFQNFKLSPTTEVLKTVTIKEYKKPLISKDNTTSGETRTSEDIEKMAGRSAAAVATTVGGVYSENGEIGSIRGARSEGTTYYIDGVKVRGSSAIPKGAIDQITVMTGGLSAEYGDATGGIISITTKGPSKETHGNIEFTSSKFLDPYDYNLGEITMTGPLVSKKIKDENDPSKIKKEPIIGYFISADLSYVKDDNPSAIGNWKVKDDSLNYVLENPYRTSESGFVSILNSEYFREDAFEKVKAKENIANKGFNLAGKLDFSPSKNINLTFGGSMRYFNRNLYSYTGALFNSANNPQEIYNTWRAYGRFMQKFTAVTPEDEEKQLVKHAYYQLQFDYSQTNYTIQDPDHKNNLFNYGYVGKFNTYKINSYGATDTVSGYTNRTVWVHNGFRDTLYTFEPSEINSDLASYTSAFYSLFPLNSGIYQNKEIVQFGGGLLNGDVPPAIYGLFSSPGTQYNGYSKYDGRQYRITGRGSGDIKKHEISIGFEFEQRQDSYYGVAPVGLWTLARNLVNFQISELNTENPHPVYVDGVFQDTINYDRLYNSAVHSEFDQKLREHLGMPKDGLNWIDFDSYDPSDLSIDYFSATELLNNGNSYVTYYGYDAHGNKQTSKPSFEDFFNAVDDYGQKSHPIAPFEPNYSAAYIQDKFSFKDLIFNIGLRVDRYDANQKVLKDAYLFYEAYTVGDLRQMNSSLLQDIPSNIEDDYIVYVNDMENPSKINGFREGTKAGDVTWYKADGSVTDDPTLLNSTSGITPYLVNPDEQMNSSAFKDYEPQITPMPRISFSFPISDVALFFAHYDILSKRPASTGRLNMIQYYYITTQGTNPINNPNLKPERTTDYELGFQQKLSNTSALKLSAFYREMKDMAQVQYVNGAYPADYITYTNIDFGTVKGMTVQYDLRRTGNVRLTANYTLQFANGTGSNIETALSLVAAGLPNIRTTLPLDFDQRHAFTANIDYRFPGGKAYNGPVWFHKDIFANAGANFILRYGTGSPYSRRDVVTNNLIGQLNGSRKPSRTTIDMRVDKSFQVKYGKGEGKDKKSLNINIYLTVENLLNTKNIINVYSTTGNPDDDGKLASAQNQANINAQNDPDSYRNYYAMYLAVPWNYSLPRRARVGVIIGF
ncbi:MAG TPA: TonB-dependent receptor [Bacteroidales bacterium]|nr:TonB-dependent receptor [Bacteroidales bacterium]